MSNRRPHTEEKDEGPIKFTFSLNLWRLDLIVIYKYCNRLAKFAPTSVKIFCKLVVNTDPSQRIYRENRSRLYLFCNTLLVEIPQLNFNNWPPCMLILECLPPCQINKPPVGKTHVTNPVNYMNTCAELAAALTFWHRNFFNFFSTPCI
jgi:hypothetical protein